MRQIGVDVGGTFTDLMLADTETGFTAVHKVPTTPEDPSAAVTAGIAEICAGNGIPRESIGLVFHGTTIATNAILEHDGARTGMVTTRGYRDIIHIGRHQRPQNYSIQQEIPWQDRPLVRRRHRKVVTERRAPPAGEILLPLDEAEVRAAARELREEGVEAVAVCFLFSYIDPAHEERAMAIIREEHPDAFVTNSASVSPQFREFERFTTTAMNAFVGPKVRRYVTRLEQRLAEAGFRAELRIMASNGGAATAAMVAEKPVLTLLSGPAAGVLGGAWTGALSDRRRLITFDVGGTSADIGIVDNGRFAEATARDTWIAGFPVMVPMIDVHTIGAGGGSIAHVDAGGAFRVGPRSAGARPGPAAYGRGGTQPTVTDANIVLGRLDKDNFLGGGMALDEDAARRVIAALAQRLGLDPLDAAEGVLTILNASMANAIRSRTVQKGIDPRDFALVAFGGAGPLHAAEVAALLGIPEVIVPPHPGITSAVGLLTTDLKYDAIKTEFQGLAAPDFAKLNRDFAALEDELRARLSKDGVPEDRIRLARAGDVRYAGQGYELRIPVAPGSLDDAAIGDLVAAFHEAHRVEYGHLFPSSPVELVNIRVTASGAMPKLRAPPARRSGSLAEALVREGRCAFRVDGRLRSLATPFYRRDRLPLDQPIPGPAIVLQMDATTVVPPGTTLVAEAAGNLILRVGDTA